MKPALPFVAACATFERALNGALSLDATSRRKLAEHDDKVVALRCTSPEVRIYVRLGDPLQVLSHYEPGADASLNGAALAWLELGASEDKAGALINGELKIDGDSQLFVELGKIAEQLDIDWEGYIATFIGDVPAHAIGRLCRAAVDFGTQTQETLERTVTDLLQEELRLTPPRAEIDALYEHLRKLEMRFDRIDAQLRRLNTD